MRAVFVQTRTIDVIDDQGSVAQSVTRMDGDAGEAAGAVEHSVGTAVYPGVQTVSPALAVSDPVVSEAAGVVRRWVPRRPAGASAAVVLPVAA
jgi:hypothetical protein